MHPLSEKALRDRSISKHKLNRKKAKQRSRSNFKLPFFMKSIESIQATCQIEAIKDQKEHES